MRYHNIMVPLLDLVIVVLIAVGCLLLTTMAMVQNRKKFLNRIFATLAVAVGVWIVTAFLSDLPELKIYSLFLNRFLLVGVISVIVGIFYLAYSFPIESKIPSWLNFTIIAITILFSLATLMTDWTIQKIRFEDWGTDPVYGPLYSVFGMFSTILLIASTIRFFKTYRKVKGLYQLQMKYLFFGLFIFMLINLFVHLVLSMLLGTVEYYKLGNYSAIIFVGSLGFAIIKHRLLDIRLVVARAIAYALLTILLGFLYVMSFLLMGQTFFNVSATESQLTLSAFLSLLIAFSFQPLLRIIERATDSIFYQDKYDSEQFLNHMGTILTATLSIDTLGKRVLRSISSILKTERIVLIIGNKDGISHVISDRGLNGHHMVPELCEFLNHQSIYVFDELSEGSKKELMREKEWGCIVTLKSKEEHIGILALGFKKNGMAYTGQDLEVLEVFSKQLSIAIQNALQFEEIEQFSEKLKIKIKEATIDLREANNKLKELDKRKDEFLSVAAHEMRAPLTAVKGYLSMVMEGDAGKVNPLVKEFISGAVEGAEREVRLVNNMLNVSRIEEGRLVYQMGTVHLF